LVVGATTVVNAESLRVFNEVKKPLVVEVISCCSHFHEIARQICFVLKIRRDLVRTL
jgi:hypothetical protein